MLHKHSSVCIPSTLWCHVKAVSGWKVTTSSGVSLTLVSVENMPKENNISHQILVLKKRTCRCNPSAVPTVWLFFVIDWLCNALSSPSLHNHRADSVQWMFRGVSSENSILIWHSRAVKEPNQERWEGAAPQSQLPPSFSCSRPPCCARQLKLMFSHSVTNDWGRSSTPVDLSRLHMGFW